MFSIDEEGLEKAADVVVADPADDVVDPNNEDDEDEDSEFKKDEPISTVSLVIKSFFLRK